MKLMDKAAAQLLVGRERGERKSDMLKLFHIRPNDLDEWLHHGTGLTEEQELGLRQWVSGRWRKVNVGDSGETKWELQTPLNPAQPLGIRPPAVPRNTDKFVAGDGRVSGGVVRDAQRPPVATTKADITAARQREENEQIRVRSIAAKVANGFKPAKTEPLRHFDHSRVQPNT